MAPVATTTDARDLHARINELVERFAMHDSKNAERFAGLEQRCKQMEKDLDKQAIKLEAIETTMNRVEGKLDVMLNNRRKRATDGDEDTDTTFRKREEVKADIWIDRLKKLGLALLAAAALYFGGRGAVDQFASHPPHPEPKEQK